MASTQGKMLTFFLKSLKKYAFKVMTNHDTFRAEKEKIFSRVPVPKSINISYFNINKKIEAARFIPPKTKHAHKVVLYLHGGGYVSGSIKSHAGLIGKLTLESGIPHVAINYRLAPEHPFPAGLDDAVEAYNWLLEKEQFAPSDIIIMGDSAGGGLVLAALLKIKSLNIPNPLAAVVISPWTDLEVVGDSALSSPEKDPILDVSIAREWAKWYAGKEELKHPLVSPLHGDLEGLPPLLIHVGTEEILFSDSIRFATLAIMKNVDVTLHVEEGMPHVWHFFWQYLPEAKVGIQKITQFLDEKINAQEQVNSWKTVDDLKAKTLTKRTKNIAQLSYQTIKLGRNILKKKFSKSE